MDDIFDDHINWQTEREYGPITPMPQEPAPQKPMVKEPAMVMNAPIEEPYVSKSRASMAAENESKGIIATPAQAAQELLNLPISTVKGAVQGFLGLPGDLETLLRGVVNMTNNEEGKGKLTKFLDGMHQDTVLPTTEKVKEFVDDNSNYFKGLRNNPMQTIGEIIAPAGQIGLAAKGFKSATALIKNSMLGKIDTGILKTNLDFKNWFGDSKIADANGNPIILYHGTMNNFSELKTPNEISSKNLSGVIWLTPDKEFADIFSMKYKTGSITPTKGGQIIPVYVKMNNPYPAYKFKQGVPSGIDDVQKLQEQGYDGVHFQNIKGRSIYLAFTKDQISPALSVPMERKISVTESMKQDRQTKKILESMQK